MDKSYNKERKGYLLELQSSKGWEILKEWLDSRDELITQSIKDQFINLKAEEVVKWGWYYNGQYSVIRDLLAYLENETADRKEIKKKPLKI